MVMEVGACFVMGDRCVVCGVAVVLAACGVCLVVTVKVRCVLSGGDEDAVRLVMMVWCA